MPDRYPPGYRFLRLFADIRRGEAAKALLLALNVFLLLMAYYILKPLRESLLLVDKNSAVIKSCLSGAQAVLFVFVIKAFSRLASKVPRHVLITWTTSFFISNLGLFYLLHAGGMAKKPMGILFFVWVGIFNYFVIAQFWGFANDLYSDEAGKRTFPLVALGATLGGLIATLPFMKTLRNSLGGNWEFKLMLIAACLLVLCIVLARTIHRRDVRRTCEERGPGVAGAAAKPCVQEQPLEAGGGFRLVFKSRYLLLIAVMIGLYNFVNATGEFIMSDVTVRNSIAAAAPAARARCRTACRRRRRPCRQEVGEQGHPQRLHGLPVPDQPDRPRHPALPGLPDLQVGRGRRGPALPASHRPGRLRPDLLRGGARPRPRGQGLRERHRLLAPEHDQGRAVPGHQAGGEIQGQGGHRHLLRPGRRHALGPGRPGRHPAPGPADRALRPAQRGRRRRPDRRLSQAHPGLPEAQGRGRRRRGRGLKAGPVRAYHL
ncbi:MAG: hypothetical protein M0C28_03220 [Candidatus Moduliflexus flocculans]|nr:hypothetical protein [Candidatus Moduliflexus flocculans]